MSYLLLDLCAILLGDILAVTYSAWAAHVRNNDSKVPFWQWFMPNGRATAAMFLFDSFIPMFAWAELVSFLINISASRLGYVMPPRYRFFELVALANFVPVFGHVLSVRMTDRFAEPLRDKKASAMLMMPMIRRLAASHEIGSLAFRDVISEKKGEMLSALARTTPVHQIEVVWKEFFEQVFALAAVEHPDRLGDVRSMLSMRDPMKMLRDLVRVMGFAALQKALDGAQVPEGWCTRAPVADRRQSGVPRDPERRKTSGRRWYDIPGAIELLFPKDPPA